MMHWDFLTYQQQPRWFIDELNDFLSIEGEHSQYTDRLNKRQLNKK